MPGTRDMGKAIVLIYMGAPHVEDDWPWHDPQFSCQFVREPAVSDELGHGAYPVIYTSGHELQLKTSGDDPEAAGHRRYRETRLQVVLGAP